MISDISDIVSTKLPIISGNPAGYATSYDFYESLMSQIETMKLYAVRLYKLSDAHPYGFGLIIKATANDALMLRVQKTIGGDAEVRIAYKKNEDSWTQKNITLT